MSAAPLPLRRTTVGTLAGRSVCPSAKCSGVRRRLSTAVLEGGYCSARRRTTSSEASLAQAGSRGAGRRAGRREGEEGGRGGERGASHRGGGERAAPTRRGASRARANKTKEAEPSPWPKSFLVKNNRDIARRAHSATKRAATPAVAIQLAIVLRAVDSPSPKEREGGSRRRQASTKWTRHRPWPPLPWKWP